MTLYIILPLLLISDSEEGGVGGETNRRRLAIRLKRNSRAFWQFFSKRERERWQTLYEAIGFARLQEIATWAEQREIHMVNRGGLLDSLETAAKKWIDNNPSRKATIPNFSRTWQLQRR